MRVTKANAGGYCRVMPVTWKGRPVTWGQGQWSLEVVGARDERVEPGGPSVGRLRRVAPAGGDMGCTAPRVRPSASRIPGRRQLSANGPTSKGSVDPGRLGGVGGGAGGCELLLRCSVSLNCFKARLVP